MSQPHLLFIVGMHRSGTSALCAALARCGVTFGPDLLDPMAGVNEEGFWEDATLVHLNDEILRRLGGSWFNLPPDLSDVDWSSAALADLAEAAQTLLRRGFGDGALQGLKDPRLSLTLPFWLAAGEQAGLPVTVCAINRAPLEVARSLQARDGFPLGYGLRLAARYQRLIADSAPPGTLYVTYSALLHNPAEVMFALASALPLTLPAEQGLHDSVKPQLRHHQLHPGDPVLMEADAGMLDHAALATAIEQAFPSDQLCGEFAQCLVERAVQLTKLGDAHTLVLATLRQRDADLESVSTLHQQALATIDQRDAQIVEFDQRLSATGDHLSLALDTLRARDEEIRDMLSLPIIGAMLRFKKRRNEKG